MNELAIAGWGDPARRTPVSPAAERFLHREVGLGTPRLPVPVDSIRLPASALPPGVAQRLVDALGAEHVRSDRHSRLLHAGGRSYPDTVRRRLGDAENAPDAVLQPASHDEVRAVLEICAEAGVAVVPFGGGTSVVGGVEPERGAFPAVVALDLGRMNALVDVDPLSLRATFEPGVRGPEAVTLLEPHGLTLGHFPQSHEYASIGGYVATRSAGQASTGYGRVDELVLGLRVATPVGDLTLGRAPASAAGPDLRALFVGSEGALGVITEATLRVHRLPDATHYEAWFFRSFAEGGEALRELVQAGLAPTVARLSDENETRATMALSSSGGVSAKAGAAWLRLRGYADGCLAILGWEGTAREVADRRRAAKPVLASHGAMSVGTGPGEKWRAHRFAGPYLRDELLDRGIMVETLETAATWTTLPAVYAAVRAALETTLAGRGAAPLVLCHVSHLYEAGASLYFTFLARQEVGTELEQWAAAKTAASRAIMAAGATITHHHAVGLDHRDYLADEIGDLGVETLRAVKARLDPTGILNPGKLIPPL